MRPPGPLSVLLTSPHLSRAASRTARSAGRFRSRYASGEVTCLDPRDMPRLRAALAAPLAPLERAGLAPSFEQLRLLDRASRHALDYAQLLRYFGESARLDARYFCCVLEPLVLKAEVIGDCDLPLKERHVLCQVPLDARDSLHTHLLHLWARDLATGADAKLRYAPPKREPSTHGELQAVESYFRALDGYLWLGQRFPAAFALHGERAVEYRARCAELIEQALQKGLAMPDAWRAGASAAGGHGAVGRVAAVRRAAQAALAQSRASSRGALRAGARSKDHAGADAGGGERGRGKVRGRSAKGRRRQAAMQ